MQAKTVIRYAPHASHPTARAVPAAVMAIYYLEHKSDVMGWIAQARRARYSAAFFMIENFYAEHATVLYLSTEDDVYGPWHCLWPRREEDLRCPIDEPWLHELQRLQSAFVDEWLFFPAEPRYADEVGAYRQSGLPLHACNIRARRLPHLQHRQPIWEFASPGSDANIVDFLEASWRLPGKPVSLSSQA